MTTQILRIRARSFYVKQLEQAVKAMIDHGRSIGTAVSVVPLPTKIEKFTVLTSPHVHKDAREQYELRTHKRIVDFVNPSPKTIDALTKLNVASGVQIDIQLGARKDV